MLRVCKSGEAPTFPWVVLFHGMVFEVNSLIMGSNIKMTKAFMSVLYNVVR